MLPFTDFTLDFKKILVIKIKNLGNFWIKTKKIIKLNF